MKKHYLSPQITVIEVETESIIMNWSQKDKEQQNTYSGQDYTDDDFECGSSFRSTLWN